MITTKINVEGHTDARREGLLAHATQIDPESKFWFGLPLEVDRTIYPYDDYRLAVGPREGEGIEDDLFAGIRTGVSS